MKNILLTLFFFASLSVGHTQESVNFKNLVERDGVFYLENTEKPYTGIAFELYKSGLKKKEKSFKNGKEDGLWTFWYLDGRKKEEGIYKNGKEDGLWTFWYLDGRKKEEGLYMDGKLISEKKY